MSTVTYGKVTEARAKLVACPDFARLRAAHHQLTDGVLLTSVSDIPYEISFRCTRCAGVFWFENLSWREGGFAQWYLTTEQLGCVASAMEWIGADRAIRMHP